MFLLVSVIACPARSPIQTFSYPEVILSPASCPNRTLLLELLFKLAPASVPANKLFCASGENPTVLPSNNLNELAVDKNNNITIVNNVSDLIKFRYNNLNYNEGISSSYYKDLDDNEKSNFINSNISGINDNNYIFKIKIEYNISGKLDIYSDLKKNIEVKELNIFEEVIDNNYSGKLISLDNSEDIELRLTEPTIGNKFKFIITNDNSVLKNSELKFVVSLIYNDGLKFMINGIENK